MLFRSTHAFFKALLFLGSGSVIHAFKDEQNINSMGGVWKKLPYTYVLMIIGTLALTGFPLLSGFYSKDAIIEFAYLRDNTAGYYAAGIGIFTAFLTSIYSWRLIFKTFHGTYNNKDIKIEETHESPLAARHRHRTRCQTHGQGGDSGAVSANRRVP